VHRGTEQDPRGAANLAGNLDFLLRDDILMARPGLGKRTRPNVATNLAGNRMLVKDDVLMYRTLENKLIKIYK
jgi:hypothetical protein